MGETCTDFFSLNLSASSFALMCELEIRESSEVWLFDRRKYLQQTHTGRDMSPPPTPKLAFEGAVRGNLRAVCHQQIQEGVKDYREEEKDVRVRIYSAFLLAWWLVGFIFHHILTCQVKSLNSVNISVVERPHNWYQNSWTSPWICAAG